MSPGARADEFEAGDEAGRQFEGTARVHRVRGLLRVGVVGTEERLRVAWGFLHSRFPEAYSPIPVSHSLSSVFAGWATPDPPRTHTWPESGLSQRTVGSIPQVPKRGPLTSSPGTPALWAREVPACPQAPPPSQAPPQAPPPRSPQAPPRAHQPARAPGPGGAVALGGR